MASGIRTISVKRDTKGHYSQVKIVFGPHYFLELNCEQNDRVIFVLGATHHGFRADASEVNGELEQFIYEIRRAHPHNLVD